MGRRLEERLEEGERLELLKSMGVKIWRLRRDSASGPVGAASDAVAAGRSGNSGKDAASEGAAKGRSANSGVGAASAAMAAEPGSMPGVAAAADIAAPGPPPKRASSQPLANTEPNADSARCELHAYSYGNLLVLADPAELSQQNRRILQDLIRALGADPDKQAQLREFIWPPAEGALFDEGQDVALTAFIERLRRNDADTRLLCVGVTARESVAGLGLDPAVLYTGALHTLRNSPEAKRELWREIQGKLPA